MTRPLDSSPLPRFARADRNLTCTLITADDLTDFVLQWHAGLARAASSLSLQPHVASACKRAKPCLGTPVLPARPHLSGGTAHALSASDMRLLERCPGEVQELGDAGLG